MTIPDFQSCFRPLLEFAQDGREKNINDTIEAISNAYQLTPEERRVKVPSGRQTLISNRVHWARTYLNKALAIEKTRRSHFRITDRGRKLLEEHNKELRVADLRKFPEFMAFHAATRSGSGSVELPSQTRETDLETPEDRLQRAFSELEAALRAELMERILDGSPEFFEKVVIDLLTAMGYGGSREDAARQLGRSGDEGVDGVINEDPLGLDVIYVEAKRYQPGNVIGREKVQAFSGALAGQGAHKGVFVTTSSYTAHAIEFANRIQQRIILIDGDRLTELMIKHGVGLRNEAVFELKRVDLDYFEE